jgi:4-diphosphocytidyl-2-C-methyl-D-erythritol kinase
MNSISIKAFAKINHTLKITGRRDDGYHLIRSHMQAISLHDDVDVEIAAEADEPDATAGGRQKDNPKGWQENNTRGLPNITVEATYAPDAHGDVFLRDGKDTAQAYALDAHDDVARETRKSRRPLLPQGEDNIAYKAAVTVLRRWGAATRGQIHIRITKRIPMAAGLAGGSADAAAVMLALVRALCPKVSLADITEAGASVGADVPFCISAIAKNDISLGYAEEDGAASSILCEGIGDELTPVAGVRGFALLVKPGIDVSTPAIYEAWDGLADDVSARSNDLEGVAVQLFPEIGVLMNEVRALTLRPRSEAAAPERVFMTGSGPVLIALYNEENTAAAGYDILAAAYKDRAEIDAVILSKLL